MDIASIAMSMSNIELSNQVGVAVLSKALDMNEVIGANMVKIIDSAAMERSVNPAVGSNFDMYI